MEGWEVTNMIDKMIAQAFNKMSGSLSRQALGITEMKVIDTTPGGCSHDFWGIWEGQGNYVETCRICLTEKSSKTIEVYKGTDKEYE